MEVRNCRGNGGPDNRLPKLMQNNSGVDSATELRKYLSTCNAHQKPLGGP